MATLSEKVTLLDVAKSLDPDGKTAKVVELLTKSNPILEYLPFVEGNLPTGHQTTVRTSLMPAIAWRKYNQGVPPQKSSRAVITETCGMLEARAEVDKDLANLNGNSAAFRLSEAKPMIESINQKMATAFFYGNAPDDPFMGFAPRYNSLSGETKDQIIDAGGSGSDQTSIYLMILGENTVHGIYPKGSKAGIEHQDLGEIDARDDSGYPYRALADLWKWKAGLVVRDHRAIIRIANIEAADLITAGLSTGTQAASAATNVLRLLVEAKHRIPPSVRALGTPVAFMNARVMTALTLIGLEKSVNALGLATAMKQAADGFDGIVYAESDGLLNTEAEVS